MSGDRSTATLEGLLAEDIRCLGEVWIGKVSAVEFTLCHRDERGREDLRRYCSAEDAAEIARYDDAGEYRPLKTAPNLCHGWRLAITGLEALRTALDLLYPGRLAAFGAWTQQALVPTPLRATLDRQSGMYRVAAKISDPQADKLIANFCRSDEGCLRTILWRRDALGTPSSTLLPASKFDPAYDQTGRSERVLPLFCQEACNLLIAEARRVVKEDQPIEGNAER